MASGNKTLGRFEKEFGDKVDRVTYIILLFDTQNYFLYNFKIKKTNDKRI